MDSTGVTPMPAEMSRTGPVPPARTKSPRGGRVQDRAGEQAVVQVAARGAARLALDVIRYGPAPERRTASSCAPGRLAGAGNPQRQVLPGLGGRKRALVRTVRSIDETVALSGTTLVTRSGRNPAQAGPGQPARCFGDQVPERFLPAGAQRGDPGRHAQLRGVAARQVEQRVGLGHAERARDRPGLDDPVSGRMRPSRRTRM